MPETVSACPLGDLHVHTRFSCDSQATMAAICQQAIELGLRQVAFTEHVDYVPADVGYRFFQPAAFLDEVGHCRERFAGQLTILAGVEIGEPHRFQAEARPLLDDQAFDLVIGSLHWVGDELVFDRGYFERRTMDQACQDYFRELERMCRAGGFDVLGHLDVVKRAGFGIWGRYDVDRYRPLITPILKVLVGNGIALEINTSTLRRPCWPGTAPWGVSW